MRNHLGEQWTLAKQNAEAQGSSSPFSVPFVDGTCWMKGPAAARERPVLPTRGPGKPVREYEVMTEAVNLGSRSQQ